MKNLLLVLSLFLLIYACGQDEPDASDTSNKIYLESNDKTIKCPNANVGDKFTVKGAEYIVVDNTTLRDMIAKDFNMSLVCTSLVTDMSAKILSQGEIGCIEGQFFTNYATGGREPGCKVSFFWSPENAQLVLNTWHIILSEFRYEFSS